MRCCAPGTHMSGAKAQARCSAMGSMSSDERPCPMCQGAISASVRLTGAVANHKLPGLTGCKVPFRGVVTGCTPLVYITQMRDKPRSRPCWLRIGLAKTSHGYYATEAEALAATQALST